jgi:curved DNA-binding protein CbpA
VPKSYYEELGIPDTATDEEIRQAYRRRAKQAHPDKGGNAEKMTQVNRAYETLIAPERRLTYDRNGQDRPPLVDQMAQATILKNIMNWMASDHNSGDMIADITAQLNREQEHLQGQVAEGTAMLTKLRKRANKLKFRGRGPDLIRQLVTQKITEIKHMVERTRDQADGLDRAKEMLKTYDYEVDPPPPVSPLFTWSSGSAKP